MPRFSVAAFGVKGKPAAGAAAEGLAQVVTGPVGHRALGLVQQRGRRTVVGSWPVGDTAAGEHVDHLRYAGGSFGLEASDTRREGLPLPGRLDGTRRGEPDRHHAGLGARLELPTLLDVDADAGA